MAENRRGDTASWDKEAVRRAQSKHKKKQRRKRFHWYSPILYVLFVVLTSALLAGVGWMLMSDLCAFNKPMATVTVEVTAQDDLGSVADKLEEGGLIKYKWFFRLFGKLAKAEQKIGIGTYDLSTDMDYRALIVGMHNSSGNLSAETVTVTIPEGYTVKQVIQVLAKAGVNTEENLMLSARESKFNYSYIDNTTEDISRLEGYLFPDTYEFYVGHNAKSALDKMISTFDKKLDDELLIAAESRGYSLKEIVIIASLIEKETDGADHRNIASVIYNRLENVGETANLLQIDAALLYGLPEHEGAITNEDKAIDTPYNLYMHKKLPPTAIANPGLESITAALDPAETDYYFYALGTDGQHHYSKTLAEHNNFLNSSSYGG